MWPSLVKIRYTELKISCGNLCGRPPPAIPNHIIRPRLKTGVEKGISCMTSAKFFRFNYMIALYMIDWLIDWLLNVQRAVFQPYSGRKQAYKQKIRKRALGWVNMGNNFWLLCWVWSDNLADAGSQCPPLSEVCRGIFNVQRAWHSLNTGPRFSFSSKGRVGQFFIRRDSNWWPW
jgi:hypothetical protein